MSLRGKLSSLKDKASEALIKETKKEIPAPKKEKVVKLGSKKKGKK